MSAPIFSMSLSQPPPTDLVRPIPQKFLDLHAMGCEILRENSTPFLNMDQRRKINANLFQDKNIATFLNTYAKVKTVQTEETLSIMSPNVLPRNMLCICTLSIGANPAPDYYAMYQKVKVQLKKYRTYLTTERGWSEKEAEEILENATRKHAKTTLERYCGVMILTRDPSVFSKEKAQALDGWLSSLKGYINESEKKFAAKAELSRLNELLRERDAEISRMGGLLQERDAEISRLTGLLRERDNTLRELTNAVSALNATMRGCLGE